MMCFFQNAQGGEYETDAIAQSSVNKDFDMAVLEILINFN
jgi:hypothetical protein